MKTFAIVPAKKFENAKSRLAPLLTLDERIKLSELLLHDTLQVLAGAASLQKLVAVSSDRRVEGIAKTYGAEFLYEEQESGVNSAVLLADMYSKEAGADATVVIPQDLPLLESQDIAMICQMATEKCMVISPSLRYDGTNALLRTPVAAMDTQYDNNSYETHIREANALGLAIKIFLSSNIMYDVDTAEDARQVTKKDGSGRAIEFLKSKVK